MKRSLAIVLTLATGAGVGVWTALSSSKTEEQVSGNLYTDINSCTTAGVYTHDQCVGSFVAAETAHDQSAPRYSKLSDCTAEFPGGCQRVIQGAGGTTVVPGQSLFVPAMAGFVIAATAAAAATPTGVPVYRTCEPGLSPQNCRTSSGGAFYTGTGYRVARYGTGSSVSLARSGFSARGSTVTMARGGFGARAAAHAGGRG